MLSLCRALLEATPSEPPASVVKSAKRLSAVVVRVEDELTDRRREQNPAEYGPPVLLDGGVDSLWVMFKNALDNRQGYRHGGLDVFVAQPQTPLGGLLAQERQLAERAAVLSARLFGPDGMKFLRGPFREQAEVTASILRLIKEDNLIDELNDIVGKPLVTSLFLAQEKYEGMVFDQLNHEPTAGENLRELRLQMFRLVGRYATSVLDMLDEDEPESLQIVITSLRPMIALREQIASVARSKGASEDQVEAAIAGEMQEFVQGEGLGGAEPPPLEG